MKTLLLLISLFCNDNKTCEKEMQICIDRKIWDYIEFTEYRDEMKIYAFHECLEDKGFLR